MEQMVSWDFKWLTYCWSLSSIHFRLRKGWERSAGERKRIYKCNKIILHDKISWNQFKLVFLTKMLRNWFNHIIMISCFRRNCPEQNTKLQLNTIAGASTQKILFTIRIRMIQAVKMQKSANMITCRKVVRVAYEMHFYCCTSHLIWCLVSTLAHLNLFSGDT